eukprot:1343222-Karenia_brevis.AAC.1
MVSFADFCHSCGAPLKPGAMAKAAAASRRSASIVSSEVSAMPTHKQQNSSVRVTGLPDDSVFRGRKF